jgi:hypothetical protein
LHLGTIAETAAADSMIGIDVDDCSVLPRPATNASWASSQKSAISAEVRSELRGRAPAEGT